MEVSGQVFQAPAGAISSGPPPKRQVMLRPSCASEPRADLAPLPTGPGFLNRGGRGRLTLALGVPIATESVGRTAAPRQSRKAAGEESPGSMDKRCRITSGGVGLRFRGDQPQGQCHRKETAAAALRIGRGKGETVR
jgi:hypothetical protein